MSSEYIKELYFSASAVFQSSITKWLLKFIAAPLGVEISVIAKMKQLKIYLEIRTYIQNNYGYK